MAVNIQSQCHQFAVSQKFSYKYEAISSNNIEHECKLGGFYISVHKWYDEMKIKWMCADLPLLYFARSYAQNQWGAHKHTHALHIPCGSKHTHIHSQKWIACKHPVFLQTEKKRRSIIRSEQIYFTCHLNSRHVPVSNKRTVTIFLCRNIYTYTLRHEQIGNNNTAPIYLSIDPIRLLIRLSFFGRLVYVLRSCVRLWHIKYNELCWHVARLPNAAKFIWNDINFVKMGTVKLRSCHELHHTISKMRNIEHLLSSLCIYVLTPADSLNEFVHWDWNALIEFRKLSHCLRVNKDECICCISFFMCRIMRFVERQFPIRNHALKLCDCDKKQLLCGVKYDLRTKVFVVVCSRSSRICTHTKKNTMCHMCCIYA